MIQTARLLIRPFAEADAQAFFELSRDRGFTLYPITDYRQPDVRAALEWIQKAIALYQTTGLGKWAVVERQSGALIGMGGLTPWQHEGENLIDITYRLRESAWGQGYGGELARALAEHAFGALRLEQITATITPDNAVSKHIAERLGLRFDRRITLLGVPTDLYRLTAAAAAASDCNPSSGGSARGRT